MVSDILFRGEVLKLAIISYRKKVSIFIAKKCG